MPPAGPDCPAGGCCAGAAAITSKEGNRLAQQVFMVSFGLWRSIRRPTLPRIDK